MINIRTYHLTAAGLQPDVLRRTNTNNRDDFQESDIQAIMGATGWGRSSAEDYARSHGGESRGYNYNITSSTIAGLQRETTRANTLADNILLQDMAEDRADARIQQSYQLAQQAADRVQQKIPEWRRAARQSVKEDVPWINEMLRGAFNRSLDKLYPEWRQEIIGAAQQTQRDTSTITDIFRQRVMPRVLAGADEMGRQAIRNAASLLRGDLPPDVQNNIRRSASEVAEQIGARSQDAGNIVARDLGLTTLQLQQAGLQQAPAALGLAPQAYAQALQTVQAPLTTAANVTNLLSAYRPPTTDPAAWYQNFMGIISQQGAISPTTVLGTSAQVGTQFAQIGAQQAQFLTEAGSQAYWNQQNYNLQQQAVRQAGKTDWLSTGLTALGAVGSVMGGYGAIAGAAASTAGAATKK